MAFPTEILQIPTQEIDLFIGKCDCLRALFVM